MFTAQDCTRSRGSRQSADETCYRPLSSEALPGSGQAEMPETGPENGCPCPWYGACRSIGVMTWKRCAGCTRAIAVTAFSCEYCGQLCDDVMDFLPKDERREAAEPVDTFEPETENNTPDFAAEAAGIPFEWDSLSGASTPEVAAPAAEAALAAESVHDPVATPWTAPSNLSDEMFAEDEANGDLSADLPAGAFAKADLSDGAPAKAEVWAKVETAEPEDEPANYGLDFIAEGAPEDDEQIPPQSVDGPAAPAASEQAKPPRTRLGTRQLAMVGGGVLAAGALIFTILGMRGAASPEPVATAAPVRPTPGKAPAKTAAAPKATPSPAAKTVKVDPDAPRWSRVTDGRWVGTRGQTAAFEVSATGRVHVWTRDVTPVLVVRCEKGNAEAFVFTQSAAQMEPQDGDHTVQIAFDGSKPASQRWPDSAEHDALFARNSLEFTRQLTQARTLQFGFTPHNAGPVIATFVLDGLEPLLASSARQCGWHRK